MKNDGGNAFPSGPQVMGPDGRWGEPWDAGMSLRDWFAGQMLNGLAPRIFDQGYPQKMELVEVQWAVASAYLLADAMLAEREKGGKP
jgi:hypothetical protein